MEQPADDRSAVAVALTWASTTMTIAAEMVVPGLLGYWLDVRLGTRVLFLFVGFAIGGTLATLQLMRIAKQQGGASPKSQSVGGKSSDDKRQSPDS